jgi:hypothetical protein
VRKASLDPSRVFLAMMDTLVSSARASAPEDPLPLEDPTTAPIEISRLIHSGRPNPIVKIRDFDAVLWLIEALSRGDAADNPCWQGQGLQGYAVHINRVDLVVSSGLAPTLFIREGVVQSLDEYRRVEGGLVRWIDEQFGASSEGSSNPAQDEGDRMDSGTDRIPD